MSQERFFIAGKHISRTTAIKRARDRARRKGLTFTLKGAYKETYSKKHYSELKGDKKGYVVYGWTHKCKRNCK